MKKSVIVLLALFGLAGCKNTPLDKYVYQTVGLKASAEQSWNGALVFKVWETIPYQEYVCQTYQCGSESFYHCETVRESCRGGATCTKRYCRWVEKPKYCTGSCGYETRYSTHLKSETRSDVTVSINGLETSDDVKKIKQLTLALDTTWNFKSSFQSGQFHEDLAHVLNADLITEKDSTFLVMSAKGYQLRAERLDLDLGGFKHGDSIRLDVNVEKSDSKKAVHSVQSTEVQVPSRTLY